MKAIYRKRALRDLDGIYDYICERNPTAAKAVTTRIRQSVERLTEFPFIGHDAGLRNVYVHAVVDYPYLIFYRIALAKAELHIVRILHAARRHPGFQEEQRAFAWT